MKRRKLFIASIVLLIACIVPGLQGLTYAQDFVNLKPGDSAETKKGIEGNFPTEHDQDKGSFMHAWKVLVRDGYKKGYTFTVKDFKKMRNWAVTTRGYELRGGVGLGVFGRVAGKRGEYKLLVDATPEQIDEINKKAIPIVDRESIYGEPLGIDSYRLDPAYLGKGKRGYLSKGEKILKEISLIIADVTGDKVQPPENYLKNNLLGFVAIAEGRGVGSLPASVFINEEKPFTVGGKELIDYGGVNKDTNQHRLLASLADTRMVPSSARRRGETYDFSPVKIKTVLFEAKFVTKHPKGFRAKFQVLNPDETAVIVAKIGDKNEKAIRKALKKMGLLTEWGNRIIVMGVMPDSPSAIAFTKLFGGKGFYDFRDQSLKQILDNPQLVKALAGAK